MSTGLGRRKGRQMKPMCRDCGKWEHEFVDDYGRRFWRCNNVVLFAENEAFPWSDVILTVEPNLGDRAPKMLTAEGFHCRDFERVPAALG